MRRPVDVYEPSTRQLPTTMPDLDYPLHDEIVRVRSSGDITFGRRKVYLATALAGVEVGMRELDDGRWLVSFADIDLGHLDHNGKRFEPIEPAPQGAAP